MAQIVQWDTGSSGAGNHMTFRAAYVDVVYGNDTTAQVDNQHRPFQTLQAAIDALGSAGFSRSTVHIMSDGAVSYNYTGTYSFNIFNIYTYNFNTINISDIPTTSLNIELAGKHNNLILNITNYAPTRIDIVSKNNSNLLMLNLSPISGFPQQIRVAGSYTSINTILNPPIGVNGINMLYYGCSVNNFNFTRTGEKTLQDNITISNCKLNNTTIRCFNVVNNTPQGDNNFVFKILNSTLNELGGGTTIELDGFAEGLCELNIANTQIRALRYIRVLGIIRCYHSSIDIAPLVPAMIHAHIPGNHIFNADPLLGKYGMTVFSNCIFGRTTVSPVFALDVHLFMFEHCSFHSEREYDTGDPDDRYRFIIWDTCPSIQYDRDIEIKHCNLTIKNTTYGNAINAFLFVRGTENKYGFLQRYYIEHCNFSAAPGTLDYLVLFDEKYYYGGPYSFLNNLPYNPISSLGANGSYDISYKYNEAATLNQSITLYALSTPNRTWIRDYYNRYIALKTVHFGTATTDAFVYHTEANTSYDNAGFLYGDSKQVIRFWNSGALGVTPEDKTHVLLPGFTGPVSLTNAILFADYKEILIINNSGIPITVNPAPGELIDGFASIVLGVNQRIRLKRVSSTEFAIV